MAYVQFGLPPAMQMWICVLMGIMESGEIEVLHKAHESRPVCLPRSCFTYDQRVCPYTQAAHQTNTFRTKVSSRLSAP